MVHVWFLEALPVVYSTVSIKSILCPTVYLVIFFNVLHFMVK